MGEPSEIPAIATTTLAKNIEVERDALFRHLTSIGWIEKPKESKARLLTQEGKRVGGTYKKHDTDDAQWIVWPETIKEHALLKNLGASLPDQKEPPKTTALQEPRPKESPIAKPNQPEAKSPGRNHFTRSKSNTRKTASYSRTNSNFVLQNLPPHSEASLPQSVVAILHNILIRGNPTLPSKRLQEAFGIEANVESIQHSTPLIGPSSPCWKRTIRGDDNSQDYPAKTFIEKLWEKYLPEWKFCRQLVLPEMPVNEITQISYKPYAHSQVDFYLPQAFLVIEIDGAQHEKSRKEDEARDRYLAKYGIKTIRIPVASIRAEDTALEKKFGEIATRLQKVLARQETIKDSVPEVIRLSEYRRSYEHPLSASDPVLRINAAMRMQLLFLELFERGALGLSSKETIGIYAPDTDDFESQSVEDLTIWLSHICQLQKADFEMPSISFQRYEDEASLHAGPERLKINWAMLSRYTDAFQDYPNVIYCRTDYLDVFLWYKKKSSRTLEAPLFREYDYSELKSSEPLRYKILLSDAGESSDEKSLIYLAENIFMQEVEGFVFNKGQLPIIENALRKEHTIGLLPTGGGKSLCYQIAAILQPGITFVVCPITSLMADQVDELNRVSITRCADISANLDPEEKDRALSEFSQGRLAFLFISPERFQSAIFRERLSAIQKKIPIVYAVIDEVHCLSEWGHDFRTSYLNLAKTIRTCCGKRFSFIALTATASINVLKNIQIELGVDDANVRTLLDYTRPELSFQIENAEGDKTKALFSLLSRIDTSPLENGIKRCGIVFTSNVNGRSGCYQIASRLSAELGKEVRYFSGQSPKDPESTEKQRPPIHTSKSLSLYKSETQNRFKSDGIDLLVATKAFGMGVNKKNIFYTVHFGIPQSMEALYQEGGRSGRDKNLFKRHQATSYVLFHGENSTAATEELFRRDTSRARSQELFKKLNRQGDLNTQFYFLNGNLIDVENETKKVTSLISFVGKNKGRKVELRANEQDVEGKDHLEKLIYRVSLLGIIDDWTVTDFFKEHYEVEVANFDNKSVLEALRNAIHPYAPEFDFSALNPASPQFIADTVRTLLAWTHNHFAYNRKQSLKNIYENCQKVISGEHTEEEFKRTLEGYFKFSKKTHLLQHVAENPYDHENWFKLLPSPTKTTGTKSGSDYYFELKNMLSRFLESYEANTGLDFISGITSLVLNNYEDSDGEDRLLSSLSKIRDHPKCETAVIIEKLITLADELEDPHRDALASTLLHCFNEDTELTRVIIAKLDCHTTQTYRISLQLERLESVNNKLDDTIARLKTYS